MRIPGDISGQDLIRYFKPYGYSVTRQTGSHIRLTTNTNGQHHITTRSKLEHSQPFLGYCRSFKKDKRGFNKRDFWLKIPGKILDAFKVFQISIQ